MRTLQDTPIDIPPHIGELVDAAVADPAVRSVVLYGSRSVGSHHAHSDWDVALVTKAGVSPAAPVIDDGWALSDKHGYTVLDEDDFLAKMNTYASLASEVALGVVLRGDNYKHREPHMAAKRTFGATTEEARATYIGLMAHMWKFLREDIMNVHGCRRSNYTLAPPGLDGASADAAERAVKLVTLSLGYPFQASHDVHVLAEALPADWRERLEALNGDTKALHEANYGLHLLEGEEIQPACEQTARRLRLTLEVAACLCTMKSPLSASDARRLHASLTTEEATKDVATMVDVCADELPDLVDQFVSVRDSWLERLARASQSVE